VPGDLVPGDLAAGRRGHPGTPGGPPSAARDRAGSRGSRGWRRRRPLARALGVAVAAGGLFALYLCQSRTAPFNSDGAANVLQGRAMITGNPLLHGWWTSDVSFYTTELPEYALVTAIRGVAPGVVRLCGALTYTLALLLALLLARSGTAGRAAGRPAASDGRTGAAGRGRVGCRTEQPARAGRYRAAVAAGLMLAPGLLGGTEVFLENPDHAGTAVPVLLCLLLVDCLPLAGRPEGRMALWPAALRRPGAVAHGAGPTGVVRHRAMRRWAPWPAAPMSDRGAWPITARNAKRWAGPAAVCALLTLAQAGDVLTLIAATVPLAAVCALRLLRAGRARHGRPGPETGALDGALLVAAALSAGLASLANRAIRALGGFDLRPLGGVSLAPLGQVPANTGRLRQVLILLFGANNPGSPHQAQTVKAHALLVAMADLHVIGLLIAGLGLAAGLAACVARRADRVTQVLVTALIAVLAAAAFTTVLRSLGNAHEIAILLPLSAALAGRTLPLRPAALIGRVLPAGATTAGATTAGATTAGRGRRRLAAAATVALGAWLTASLAELCYAAAWPPAQSAQQAVSDWLTAHHEHEGLSGYWQATVTTVISGGRVIVAPIVITAPASGAARPSADRWESASPWYQPAKSVATFVIAVTPQGTPGGTPGGGLSPTTVRAAFGPPAAQHQVGQYLIMLYRRNLLTRLPPTPFPGPN
jgi:hypothetical protein